MIKFVTQVQIGETSHNKKWTHEGLTAQPTKTKAAA